ncbi:glutamate receptor 2.7-like [Mercurialis annua]|uniref:glutamate receptor 2.7-like n=1 Tax=Mercurialis annua TaxID=3986 RepID=UPI00215EDC42|nr:glutamate receptor 2.7-like [Mercurialis annua]
MGKNSFKVEFYLIFFLSLIILLVEGSSSGTKLINIGAVVDLEAIQGKSWDDRVGKSGLSCINMSLSDFTHTHPQFPADIVFHTTVIPRNSTVLAATAATELIKEKKVEALFLGPATPAQTNFIVELGQKAQVPIISFSETSFSLHQYSKPNPYYFKSTIRSDPNQAKAITKLIKGFGVTEAVPIYVDDEYGQGVIPHFTEAFRSEDIHVPCWIPVSPSATNDQIFKSLEKLKNLPPRVFVVHMFPDLGFRFFAVARELGLMKEEYVWIVTDLMADFLVSSESSVMEGVFGVKPYVPETKMFKNFELRWKMKLYSDLVDAPMNIYGQLAYDAATALAKAFEKLLADESEIYCFGDANCNASESAQNGPALIRALGDTSFEGLTGDFHISNRTSELQLVKVDSDGVVKGVGCWTTEEGHNSSCAPTNWGLQKVARMRVAVPEKQGFRQFVNVTKIPNTDNYSSTPTGYCISLFKTLIQSVPHSGEPEYSMFSGSYDELVDLVHQGKFDAAVGDVTLTGDRSKLIDFTLPYMNSGVYLILPVRENLVDTAWEFTKPLTGRLWLATFCFFIFIAFVVWVLEHRINEDFQGPPSRQIGTSFWFSFSTIVFSQRERVVSNLARTVVIIWCFVGLILTQAYTASYTSYLTTKKFQPNLDLTKLMNQNVGYQNGSFVENVLTGLGFNGIIAYDSAEECHQLLINGKIAVAFDELPYAKLIVEQSCGNYTMIDTSLLKASYWRRNVTMISKFRTDGIGFVFPKGSRLAPLVSTAMLELMDHGEFKELEEKWFGDNSCDLKNGSDRLDITNFMGLFLISGIVSFLALFIYITMFVYQYKNAVMPPDSKTSTWNAICHLLKIFNQSEHHTSKKDEHAPANSPVEKEEPEQPDQNSNNRPLVNPVAIREHPDQSSNNQSPVDPVSNREHPDQNSNNQPPVDLVDNTNQEIQSSRDFDHTVELS